MQIPSGPSFPSFLCHGLSSVHFAPCKRGARFHRHRCVILLRLFRCSRHPGGRCLPPSVLSAVCHQSQVTRSAFIPLQVALDLLLERLLLFSVLRRMTANAACSPDVVRKQVKKKGKQSCKDGVVEEERNGLIPPAPLNSYQQQSKAGIAMGLSQSPEDIPGRQGCPAGAESQVLLVKL